MLLIIGCNTNNKRKSEIELQDNNAYLPLPKEILSPKNNPSSPEKIVLGKLLFFDPILSGNRDVACATCHHPDFGYAEFRDLSIGVNGTGLSGNRKFNSPNNIPFVKRNAHTVLNSAYNGMKHNGTYNPEAAPMFWDSRVQSLEDQALEPIKALEEMRGNHIPEDEILDTLVNRLRNIPVYVQLFEDAFDKDKSISGQNIAKSIAAFERTLAYSDSRFDKFVAGDENALSMGEKDGFKLFKKALCINCHNGPMFSDYKMHVLSVPDNKKLNDTDDGFEQTYGFRTPTLRNLRYTTPYMHNGSFEELQDVLEFYEDISSGISQNPLVQNHDLDEFVHKIDIKVKDMGLIISFLNSLNNENFDRSIPKTIPSNLSVGGDIH